jgi:hypothetical protein
MKWSWHRTIATIRRLDIKPGDRFVITFPRRISPEEAQHVAEVISVRFQLDPAVNPVAVLDDGATAFVLATKKGEHDKLPAFAERAITHTGSLAKRSLLAGHGTPRRQASRREGARGGLMIAKMQDSSVSATRRNEDQ